MLRFRSCALAVALLATIMVQPALAGDTPEDLLALCPCEQLPATTYLAGNADAYAQPTDPASRGTELNTAFPGNIWKDFDDATVNAHVGHTFSKLPRNIVCARLEIHMRPSGDLSDNDTLYLRLLPSLTGAFDWASRNFALPGVVGAWDTTNNPNPAPIILDLGNLPTTSPPQVTSLLDQLNLEGRLDLLVQDDTEVDYVKLTLWTFPETTVNVGITDSLLAPTEATSRGSALNAAFPAVPWKDLDDTRSNRWIGHTFTSLTGNLVQASLDIRMRPHNDVPSNDSLNLGLNPGPAFALSSTIASLPETGGSWSSNPLTDFHLDLAGLLGKINTDDRLDLVVQDDSAADSIRLRYRTCPAPRRFRGLPHTALGAADLAVSQEGFLAVSGFGSDLESGVRIDSGPAEAVELHLAPIEFDGLPPDATLELQAKGRLSNQLDTSLYITRLSRSAEGFSILNDLSPLGLSHQQIEVLRDGQLVYTSEPLPASSTTPQATAAASGRPIVVVIRNCDIVIVLPGPAALSVPAPGGGTTEVEGDTLRFVPAAQLPPNLGLGGLTSIELRGRNLTTLGIENSGIKRGSAFASALSAVELASNDEGLTAIGFGSSGEDGLGVALGSVGAVSASLAPIDPAGVAAAGAFLEAEAFGEIDGAPDQSLGTLRVTKLAAGVRPFEVTADFSAIDSPTQRVQVVRDGQVVLDEPGHTGIASRASSWPRRIGKLGGETECYTTRFPEGTSFEVDGQTVTGDELRVLAEGPGGLGDKSALQLRAAGLAEFTLTDVTTGSDAGCVPGPTTLCLNGGRFALEADFATQNGDRGQAQAVSLTDDTGYFWFFDPDNVEVVVKVLNGCVVNDRFWVFSAGLTNVEVDLEVTDTLTGEVEHYVNPLRTPYPPKLDTSAFATCDAARSGSEPAAAVASPDAAMADLQARLAKPRAGSTFEPRPDKATELLLNQDRFRVTAAFRTQQGQSGAAQAVELTGDTGYFWFFNQDNVEVVIKVLDACGLNQHFWVFAAGLTNVEVTLTITDTQNGNVRTYTSPLGQPFQPIQDTGALPCS